MKRALVAGALLFGACSTGTGSPAGAVRAFSDAAQSGDRGRVWSLLGPETQRRLEAEAIHAAPLAARRTLSPQDLLGVGWFPPKLRLVDVKELSRDGEHATVEVRGAGGEREAVRCARVGRDWRVEL